jgi:hypothetical protein
MYLSNQIRCKKCGDEPWSAHRHDFKYCKCGAVAVDGGMDYLRRLGNPEDYEEMSIEMDNRLVGDCRQAIEEAIDTNRNSLGILCAVMRQLRDSGYSAVASDSTEELRKALIATTDELESWWRDQGSYGTSRYDEWIPELRALIRDTQ